MLLAQALLVGRLKLVFLEAGMLLLKVFETFRVPEDFIRIETFLEFPALIQFCALLDQVLNREFFPLEIIYAVSSSSTAVALLHPQISGIQFQELPAVALSVSLYEYGIVFERLLGLLLPELIDLVGFSPVVIVSAAASQTTAGCALHTLTLKIRVRRLKTVGYSTLVVLRGTEIPLLGVQ